MDLDIDIAACLTKLHNVAAALPSPLKVKVLRLQLGKVQSDHTFSAFRAYDLLPRLSSMLTGVRIVEIVSARLEKGDAYLVKHFPDIREIRFFSCLPDSLLEVVMCFQELRIILLDFGNPFILA